ncbi:MAG: type II toxin-antitoxin system Phd/YefM family antitoxin [Spirochaetota bacterium]
METVGAFEAKTHFSQLLQRVLNGERITITRHGVPVAVLQPYVPVQQDDAASVIAELREFRRKHLLEGLSLRELREEGRR